MNYTFVVLGILLVFILFILYKVFTEKKTQLESSSTLSNTIHEYENLKEPGSQKYYIAIWLYVTNTVSGEQCVYTVSENNIEVIGLYLNSGSLKYKSASVTITIMDDQFPLQRWTHVILSVDNGLVDSYVDGKLVTSNEITITPTTANSQLKESGGNSPTITAEIAGFERVPETMTPVKAWTKYMSGNGGNAFTRFLKTLGISLVLTKDDVDQKTLSFPPV